MLTESNINVNALSSLRNSCKCFFLHTAHTIHICGMHVSKCLVIIIAKANKKADGSRETSSSSSDEAVEEVGGQG